MIEAEMPLWLKGFAWDGAKWHGPKRFALCAIDSAVLGEDEERPYVDFCTSRGAIFRCYLDDDKNRQIITDWINGE